jgi:hypothetical protein
MRTAEFEAEVKNGTIEIPAEYRDRFGDLVRVTLSSEEPESRVASTILDQWLASPIRISDFQLLSREQAHER